MAPTIGLEPITYRLTADCSAIELSRHLFQKYIMVGLNGIEPSTLPLSGVRSNQLSYRPISLNAPLFYHDILYVSTNNLHMLIFFIIIHKHKF